MANRHTHSHKWKFILIKVYMVRKKFSGTWLKHFLSDNQSYVIKMMCADFIWLGITFIKILAYYLINILYVSQWPYFKEATSFSNITILTLESAREWKMKLCIFNLLSEDLGLPLRIRGKLITPHPPSQGYLWGQNCITTYGKAFVKYNSL